MVKKKAKKKKKRRNADEVSVRCGKCGHINLFPSVEDLDDMPSSTPCGKCGHLFLVDMRDKMSATMDLLHRDPKAVAILKSGNLDQLNAYIKEKTGLS